MNRHLVACALVASCTVAAPLAAQSSPPARSLDSFETTRAWSTAPSEGVSLRLVSDAGVHGRAMRMDFDFHGQGGYAIARRALPLDLPENYAFSFWIKGNAPANNLEFKLVDPSGENVWWVNRRDYHFPNGWTQVTYRKRQIEFAWGPAGGGDMRRVGAIELSITAGSGGQGSVWIDELALEPRPPDAPYARTPSVVATPSAPGADARAIIDGDTLTAWRSSAAGAASATLDFLQPREFGGLVIAWDSLDYATDYDVDASRDGRAWTTLRAVRGGGGARDYLMLPESEARWLRLRVLRSSRGRGVTFREIEVKPLAFAASPNAFFEAIAAESPVGSYPKYLSRTQSYWTVLGAPADEREGLFDEEGMLELMKGGPSLEPFLYADGRLITWHDARRTPRLDGGAAPFPATRWDAGDLALDVTAFASGDAGRSTLWARYRVINRRAASRVVRLAVALRPFQVNPSWQFLNTPGGVAELRDIAYEGRTVRADSITIVPVTRPSGFGASTFDMGNIVDRLRHGALPNAQRVRDSVAHASAALAYDVTLAANDSADVYVAIPLHRASAIPPVNLAPAAARAVAERALAVSRATWDSLTARASIELPPSGLAIARTIRAELAYILVNQDGAAIQPGSRAYERSWVRDGALTSAALLRFGLGDRARAFAEWYAPFQFASGKVPCCVDRRGADPVPENDSHGELIYLIAENVRYTGDTAFARRMWPHVARAAAYIDSLRRTHRTPAYRASDSLRYFGLLPASISHEGYSAKPMHSYWDQLFALRGLEDAAELAARLGERDAAARLAASRDEFRADLVASYRRAMIDKGIDFLPGAAELGDFDATSTTIAVTPVDEMRSLLEGALRRTFDRYWEEFVARRDGRKPWENYTPYELRVVGTFVRLGEKARAHAVLDWLMDGQRPAAWAQWAEVVWHDPATPKFIGDMPHTWVGSDFLRSAADMFAYEREADSSLVVGAGVTAEWVNEAPGVRVRALRTHYGPLGYAMRATAPDVVRITFDAGTRIPPGGIVLRSPLDRPLSETLVDGRVMPHGAGEIVLRELPRWVELRY